MYGGDTKHDLCRVPNHLNFCHKTLVCSLSLLAFSLLLSAYDGTGSESTLSQSPSTRIKIIRSPGFVTSPSSPALRGAVSGSPRLVQAVPQDDLVPVNVSQEQATSTNLLSYVSVLIGSAVGFAAALIKRKSSPQPEEDPEAPRRAPWVAGLAVATALTLPQALVPDDFMPLAMAGLPSSDPISNPETLLRYALPIQNKEIREIQKSLEAISRQLRVPGSKPTGPISKLVSSAQNVIKNDRSRKNIIAAFAPDKVAIGTQALNDLDKTLDAFQAVLKDGAKQEIPLFQEDCLQKVGVVEEAMVKGMPFEVPAKYARLPQLRGRAVVEAKIKIKDNVDIEETVLTMVLDGYNAPLSAGNFMDLVNKKFYDGMTIQRSDGFVVQTGKPSGSSDGYVDPNTNSPRIVPFEVKVVGDKDPYYENTLEDLGVYNAPVALPFNAYGTMAIARREFNANSGSSQVFWLLKDAELTPVGNNVMDGRYAAFGYITKNQATLKDLKVGDTIEYMKVISGQENFVPGNPDAPPVSFQD